MGLVDEREFDRGKKHACAYWLDRKVDDVAEAFLLLRLEACRFGLDQTHRIAWADFGGLRVGLRFDAETGEYETSFFRRPSARKARKPRPT